jgi:hypothetical protein
MGSSESINGKVQRVKYTARGFRKKRTSFTQSTADEFLSNVAGQGNPRT